MRGGVTIGVEMWNKERDWGRRQLQRICRREVGWAHSRNNGKVILGGMDRGREVQLHA